MSDGEWWSKTRLKKPKDEGGIGAAPENIQAVFDAEPELFEKATGKQLGKSKGTYYRLKGSEHESPMLTLATLATHPEEGESEHHASRLEESDAVLSHSPWPPSGDARSRDSLDGGGSRPDDIDFGGTTRDVKD